MFNEEDQDLYALIFTGPILLAGLLGGSGAWIAVKGHEATAWIIGHKILVGREDALIPILDAGLDTARVILIAAVAFLLLWGTVAGTRRKRGRA